MESHEEWLRQNELSFERRRYLSVSEVSLCSPELYAESEENTEAAWMDYVERWERLRDAHARQGAITLDPLPENYRKEWEKRRSSHLEYTAAKNVVENFLRDPWRTKDDERYEQLKTVAAWSYRFSAYECPTLSPNELLPANPVETQRWLTFSTEAWAQGQPAFDCYHIADPTTLDRYSSIHFVGGPIYIAPNALVQRQDSLFPFLEKRDGVETPGWVHRSFKVGYSYISAVIRQWVEEDEDGGAFGRLLQKHPRWNELIDAVRRTRYDTAGILGEFFFPNNPSVVRFVEECAGIELLPRRGVSPVPVRGCMVTTFVLGYSSIQLHPERERHIKEMNGKIILGKEHPEPPGLPTGVLQTVNSDGWLNKGFHQRAGVDDVLESHRTWVKNLPSAFLGDNSKPKANSGRPCLNDELAGDIAAYGRKEIDESALLALEFRRESLISQAHGNGPLGPDAKKRIWKRIAQRINRAGLPVPKKPGT